MTRRKILLVDDDPSVRRLLSTFFSDHAFLVEEADSFEAAYGSFKAVRPDIAVVDFRLPDGTALELVPKLKELEPAVPIIVLTGFGSMELGVALIKSGAEQVLAKPIEPAELDLVVQKLLENTRNQQKQLASKSNRKRSAPDPFLGESPAIRALAEKALRVAHSNSPVLIQGETGTGKGVLANWLHENSDRADEPLIDLNCAGLSKEFLETELFGYEKGAYTGAVNPKPGLLEVAHRGTVFLDEIGDVDQTVQPKLLKVVEEKRFRRLGDVRDRFVDVRLIAATHQDLARQIEEKKFRSDLYYRISTVPIVLPPLRDRVEDIAVIARELLLRITVDMGKPQVDLDPSAVQSLQSYSWPGNIREMRNVLEHALMLTDKRTLVAADFSFAGSQRNDAAAYNSRLSLAELERLHIERVLSEELGNVASSAERLGIPKSTLYQKLKQMGLNRQ
jgi:DNA-binding NtrC family response regulator